MFLLRDKLITQGEKQETSTRTCNENNVARQVEGFCISYFAAFKQLLDEVFVISEKHLLRVEVISFCFFTDGKQHKARERDMIYYNTLSNHATRSYIIHDMVR